MAPRLSKSEARIDWSGAALDISNRIRAFNPWPVAFTFHREERIRVLAAAVAAYQENGAAAGTIVRADKRGVDVACGDGALTLHCLQRDGGKALPAADFLNGYPIAVGERLG